MGTTRRLVVVSAGLSTPSSTRLLADRLASATTGALAQRGVAAEVEVVELREYARDLADHLTSGFANAHLRPVLDAVAHADGLVVVTPVFSASYSGLFKTFFDVLDKEVLADKPVLLGATAGTARHSLVLEHALRPLFSYLRAAPTATAVFAATGDWAGPGGVDAALAQRITRAGRELAEAVAARHPAVVADEFATAPSFTDLLRGN
ncbi:FMN reductase [Crossiella equi]|uniref:FMN reductase n=1 Tax=Crossiella equi TaxID=130796 RepID=A0ABS5AQU0_9PSEU|nr:FMN reductase [Crossiella equi]MBP2478935.1 FMN reductase [Crossiella equi]